MSCRHDLALTTCSRCYPGNGGLDSNGRPQVDPGPEEDYEPSMEGPGAVTKEQYLAATAKQPDVKLVMVFRTDLKDVNGKPVPVGKLLAHAGHAGVTWLLNRVVNAAIPNKFAGTYHVDNVVLSEDEWAWATGAQTKIALKAEGGLPELRELESRARAAELEVHLIIDAARNVFAEPTVTCLAIGPADVDAVNEVTGHLKLLR